jgi:peptidoglycan/xylan/chitin deacetylase (PgdA/CDA1 family)
MPINHVLFRIIRILGIPFFIRETVQKNKVTILVFHDLSYKAADKLFACLIKKYNVIDLNDLIHAIENKDASKLPKKSLIITFDDGHIRNHEMLPAVRKYKVPITIFLCASIINTNRHYWFKYKISSHSTSQLKRISTDERLKLLSDNGFEQGKDFAKPQALQKIHIEEMKPFVNMQAHTLYHPILPKCTYAVAKTEISVSKKILENDFKLNINAIAYPNGDYSDRDIELAKNAGYKCGVTVDYGFNTIHSDLFRLKRLPMSDNEDTNELLVKASGVWSFIKTINGRMQKFGYSKTTE